MIGPNDTTATSPMIRMPIANGYVVTIIDMTGTGTGTGTACSDNALTREQIDAIRQLGRMNREFAKMPWRHIPWTAPQFWRQNWNPIDFPYCRGKLAANARDIMWLVTAKPCRAEPGPWSILGGVRWWAPLFCGQIE